MAHKWAAVFTNFITMTKPSVRSVIVFYIITLVTIYLITRGISGFLLQGTSTGQITALFVLFLYIIASGVAYLIYFKATELKLKDLFSVMHPKEEKLLPLNIMFILLTILICTGQYLIYQENYCVMLRSDWNDLFGDFPYEC